MAREGIDRLKDMHIELIVLCLSVLSREETENQIWQANIGSIQKQQISI
jgi:hypothetical protein